MNRRNDALFWAFAGLAATAGLVALMLPEHAGDRQDCLTIVDWKVIVVPGRPEEYPFVVYAGEHAWVEIHVEAPATGAGVDVATWREGSPFKDLSGEKILGKRTLVGTVPGDVYTLKVVNRGPDPAPVRVQVVRDYSR